MESEIIAILRAASERGLPSLLIGAHALILFGRLRNTVDLDLLVPRTIDRAGWTSCANSATAFSTARTPSRNSKRPPQRAPVDLMFVDRATWERLIEGARKTKLEETGAAPTPEISSRPQIARGLQPNEKQAGAGLGRHPLHRSKLSSRSHGRIFSWPDSALRWRRCTSPNLRVSAKAPSRWT